MASVVGSASNHGFTSLVLNRTRPGTFSQIPASEGMSTQDVVEISDDEAESSRTALQRANKQILPQQEPEAGPSSRPRHEFSSSPVAYHDNKRQRLDEPNAPPAPASSSIPATVPKIEYPRVHLNFVTDDEGATQAYPDFFGDAFVQDDFVGDSMEVDEVWKTPVEQKKEILPPYFDDPKLHIRMFRGPGFEHFPVPVDLDPKHQEVCNKWDQKMRQKEERIRLQQTRYNEFGPYVDHTIEAVVDDDNDNEDEGLVDDRMSPVEVECLVRIMDILPNVEHEFALSKIRSNHESFNFGGEEIEILPDTSAIIAEILEMDDYPKEKAKTEQSADPFEAQTGKTIKWTNFHRNNLDYKKDAVVVLASQFEYVPTHYISKVMQENASLWAAYVHIEAIDSNYFQNKQRPYQRSRRPRLQLEKKYQRSNLYLDKIYYANIVNELQAVKQHIARDFLKKDEEQQLVAAEKANLQKHKVDGLVIECQCCFDDEIPVNRAVTCTAVSGEHFFCFNCVENLANTQIGLMRHEMSCMDGSGCKEKLDMDGIGRAIPIKTFDRLLFNEQQAEIAAANIEGLEQCPFCDFKAICEPIELDTIFSCQNQDCFKVTCRKCHEISHLPKTCEEIRKDRGLHARHKVEEARSAAMMRPCPKCKTAIIKETGCNKMRCQCGAILCYVCKMDLSNLRDGYEHFDRTKSRADKCALYDTPGIDRHIQEANEAEVKAIQEAKAEDATLEESTLRIETNRNTNNTTAPVAKQMPEAQQNRWARFPPIGGRRRHRNHHRNEPVAPFQAPPLFPAFPGAFDPPPPFYAPDLQQNQNAAFANNNAAVEAWRNQVHPPAVGIAGQGIQAPQPNADLNFARENVRQLQEAIQWNRLDQFDIQNQPDNMDFNVDAELDRNARDVEFLIAANRVQDFRADMERRRSQVRRRNSERDDQNAPLQYPNPAFFNLAKNFQQPGFANQPQAMVPQPQQGQIYAQPQAHNDIQQANHGFEPVLARPPAQNLFNPPQFPLQRANTWRDQFRPPTPIPRNAGNHSQAGNVIINRGHPLRRRTMPAPEMNDFGNNNAVNNQTRNFQGNRNPTQNNGNANNVIQGQHNGSFQQPQNYPGFNFF